ncbi:MAG: tetratricopeptide repeat protein [Candidatus Thorarchaeota archaeon]|jgi:tetratricopeptide (TPR) repeat protein
MELRKSEVLLRCAEQHPDSLDKWLDLSNYAVDRYLVGLGEKAIIHASKLDPDNVDVLDLMGKILNRNRKMKKTLKHYSDAVKLYPKSPSLITGLGTANFHLGHVDVALKRYVEALSIEPGFAWALGAYISILIDRKNFKEAQAAIDLGLEKNPDNALIWARKYDVLRATNSPDSDTALSKILELLPITPPDDQRRASSSLMQLADIEHAVEVIQKIIKNDPENVNARLALASFYTDRDVRMELSILSDAIEIDPENPFINQKRIMALINLGNIETATKLLEEARKKTPEDSLLVKIENYLRSQTKKPDVVEPDEKKDTEWAFFLDLKTLGTTEVEIDIPVGSILMKGNVTIITDSSINTPLHEHPDVRYFVVREHGFEEINLEDTCNYLKPHLVKFMVEQNLLPINARIKSTSKPLVIRLAAKAPRLYLPFDISIYEDDVPGKPIDFALGLTKTEEDSGWTLVVSPSGHARCKICNKPIPKGSLRFEKELQIYFSSTLKRHPHCMRPRSFGYVDPRKIDYFDKLDLADQDRILDGIMGWRSPLIISEQAYSDISKIERLEKQNSILSRMNIGIDLLEFDILDELRECYQEKDFHKYQSDVSTIAKTVLRNHLDNNGFTLFLDTGKMKPWPEFSSLIPDILELRKAEMENCIVSKIGNTYDLRALWLTHWGFKLLRLTHGWLTASAKTIVRVKEIMATAGFEINIQETDSTPIHVRMSDNMRDFVWSHGRANKKTLDKFNLAFN